MGYLMRSAVVCFLIASAASCEKNSHGPTEPGPEITSQLKADDASSSSGDAAVVEDASGPPARTCTSTTDSAGNVIARETPSADFCVDWRELDETLRLLRTQAASCGGQVGPFGGGHLFIVFSPDGKVRDVRVDTPPFPGTPVASCVESIFRAARIQPFHGARYAFGASFEVTPQPLDASPGGTVNPSASDHPG
jgi:hypothetical protein